jgi:hypothetical protein
MGSCIWRRKAKLVKQPKKVTTIARVWAIIVFLTTMTVTAVYMGAEVGWHWLILFVSFIATWATLLVVWPLPLLILSFFDPEIDPSALVDKASFGFDIEDKRNKDIFWRVTTVVLGLIAARFLSGGDSSIAVIVFATAQFVAQGLLRTLALPLYDKLVERKNRTP